MAFGDSPGFPLSRGNPAGCATRTGTERSAGALPDGETLFCPHVKATRAVSSYVCVHEMRIAEKPPARSERWQWGHRGHPSVSSPWQTAAPRLLCSPPATARRLDTHSKCRQTNHFISSPSSVSAGGRLSATGAAQMTKKIKKIRCYFPSPVCSHTPAVSCRLGRAGCLGRAGMQPWSIPAAEPAPVPSQPSGPSAPPAPSAPSVPPREHSTQGRQPHRSPGEQTLFYLFLCELIMFF